MAIAAGTRPGRYKIRSKIGVWAECAKNSIQRRRVRFGFGGVCVLN